MTDDLDLRLKALLAAPEREPDRGFAERVRIAVVAEERMRAARSAAWRRFGTEMIAAAVALLSFVLLAKATPAGESAREIPLFSPASAGLLLLALWVAVAMRPGSAPSRF